MSFVAPRAVPIEACCSSFILPQLGGRKYFFKGAKKSSIREELKKNRVIASHNSKEWSILTVFSRHKMGAFSPDDDFAKAFSRLTIHGHGGGLR